MPSQHRLPPQPRDDRQQQRELWSRQKPGAVQPTQDVGPVGMESPDQGQAGAAPGVLDTAPVQTDAAQLGRPFPNAPEGGSRQSFDRPGRQNSVREPVLVAAGPARGEHNESTRGVGSGQGLSTAQAEHVVLRRSAREQGNSRNEKGWHECRRPETRSQGRTSQPRV